MSTKTLNNLFKAALFFANIDNVTTAFSKYEDNNYLLAFGELGCSTIALILLGIFTYSYNKQNEQLKDGKSVTSGFVTASCVLSIAGSLALIAADFQEGTPTQQAGTALIAVSKFFHPLLTNGIDSPDVIENKAVATGSTPIP